MRQSTLSWDNLKKHIVRVPLTASKLGEAITLVTLERPIDRAVIVRAFQNEIRAYFFNRIGGTLSR